MLIAISLTVWQVYNEYIFYEDALINSLKKNKKVFSEPLSSAIWNLDESQIDIAADAIINDESIVGVLIEDTNSQIIKQKGTISRDKNSSKKFLFAKHDVKYDSNLLKYPFTLLNEKDSKNILAMVTLYGDKNYIYDKLKKDMFYIVSNSILKSIVLLLLFVYFSEKIISRTLRKITTAMNTSDEDIHKKIEKDDLNIYGDNEVTSLVDSYNLMQERLEEAKKENAKKDKIIESKLELIDKYIVTSTTDLAGIITGVSKAFCTISGYKEEELVGQHHDIIRDPSMPSLLFKDLWETLANGDVWKGEIKNQRKDGSYYWVNVTIFPSYDDVGNKIAYSSIQYNITDKKIIEELTMIDALTGICNRRCFDEMLPKILNAAKRENKLVSFLMIDIDHFKEYNDMYGHQKGDEVLTKIAQLIQTTLNRADDHCFRLGGEEFVALFSPRTHKDSLEFAKKIKDNIENLKIEHKGNDVSEFVTISIGHLCKNVNAIKDESEIYKNADDLLYEAKNSGRNKVVSS